jgi:hypothetical protein
MFTVASLALISCAENAPPDSPSLPAADDEGAPPPTGPTINWDLPYGPGAATSETLADAAMEVSFEFENPSFGKPDVIQVLPANLVENADQQAVAMIFHLAAEGTILLEIRPAGEFTVDVMKEMVAAREGEPADVAPGDAAAASFIPAYQMVSLRGSEAMWVQGRGLGRVTWIEKGIRYDLMGETATAEQVLSLAADF